MLDLHAENQSSGTFLLSMYIMANQQPFRLQTAGSSSTFPLPCSVFIYITLRCISISLLYNPCSISHSLPLWGPEMNYRCLFCDSLASGSTSSLSKMTFPAARCTWDISSSPLSVWLAPCSPGSSEGRSHWYLLSWHRSHGESLLLCS